MPTLYKYCCGCVGFAHENERAGSDGEHRVVGDALIIRACDDGDYGLFTRTVDVRRFYSNGEPWDIDGKTMKLTPELVEHHLNHLRNYIDMGYRLEQIRRLFGVGD